MKQELVTVDLESNAKTSCEDCVFAEYSGLTQKGCSLNRIHAFLLQNVPIKLKILEGGKISYVIERVCMAVRKKEWAKANEGRDLSKLVREEMKLQLHCLVYADKEDDNAIFETIRSLSTQKLMPAVVDVVLNYKNSKPGRIIARLQDDYSQLPKWMVQKQLKVYERKGQAIDEAVRHCESPFYSIFNAGFKVNENFISDLDFFINDRLERFLYLTGDSDGNGDVVVTQLHKHLGGNEPVELVRENDIETVSPKIYSTLLDKVSFVCEDNQIENMIKPVEVYSCLT